jgi:phosphatidylglycerol:prolipoprotein diacylglycerol transferase
VILQSIDFPNINPAALTLPFEFDLLGAHLGPFPLRWYALAYIAGLMLGWWWMVRLTRQEKIWGGAKPPVSKTQIDDFLFWATLGVIIGGRLGYVLFYKPDMIWKSFPEVFQLWNGGMSFHGGLIGVALAAFWFARQLHVDETAFESAARAKAVETPPEGKASEFTRVREIGWIKKTDFDAAIAKARTIKVDLLRLGDLAAAAAPIGLFFGRIANFINAELYGRVSDAPWAMRFPAGGYNWATQSWAWSGFEQARHPSQLYEAGLEGIALFAIINIAIFRFQSLLRPGLNIGLFLASYGFFRLSLEFVREPDQHMPEALRGYLTMGMLLSLPMIAIGIWLIRRALLTPKPAAA